MFQCKRKEVIEGGESSIVRSFIRDEVLMVEAGSQ
jgi:hypothetical protein